jgi:hypothetical protein
LTVDYNIETANHPAGTCPPNLGVTSEAEGVCSQQPTAKSQEPTANRQEPNAYIAEAISHYSAMPDVLAWKMPGAGGGGYLALVVNNAKTFVEQHPEAFELHIRRE